MAEAPKRIKIEPVAVVGEASDDNPEVINLTEVAKIEAKAFIKEIKRSGFQGPELTPENCYRLGQRAACRGEIKAPTPLEAGLREQVAKEVCINW